MDTIYFREHPLYAQLQAMLAVDVSDIKVPVKQTPGNSLAAVFIKMFSSSELDTERMQAEFDVTFNWDALNYVGSHLLYAAAQENAKLGMRLYITEHLVEDHDHSIAHTTLELYGNAFARYYGGVLGLWDAEFLPPALERTTGMVRYSRYLTEIISDIVDNKFDKLIERTDSIYSRYKGECGAVAKFYNNEEEFIKSFAEHQAKIMLAKRLAHALSNLGVEPTSHRIVISRISE